jgi:hypothetical protein
VHGRDSESAHLVGVDNRDGLERVLVSQDLLLEVVVEHLQLRQVQSGLLQLQLQLVPLRDLLSKLELHE